MGKTWKANTKPPCALASAIARDIFSSGDEPNDKVHRIAFRGGDYNGVETDLGGFCEEALARRIETSLRCHLLAGGKDRE